MLPEAKVLLLGDWLRVSVLSVVMCSANSAVRLRHSSLTKMSKTERRTSGPCNLFCYYPDSYLQPGRLWIHYILMAAEGGGRGKEKTKQKSCSRAGASLSLSDSFTEDLGPCPFIVLNKKCDALVQ